MTRTRRHRIIETLCLAIAAAIAMAGCSSSGSPSQETSRSGSLPTLSIAIGENTAAYGQLFIAGAEGFFRKAGVNVTVTNYGTNFETVALSGHADIAVSGVTASFGVKEQGKDVEIIDETTKSLPGGIYVAANSKYHTVQELSGARYASFGPGGSSYGVGAALSNYIADHGGKPLDLAPLSNVAGQFQTTIIAGGADLSYGDPEATLNLIDSGELRWILAPTNPILSKNLIPLNSVGFGAWGLTSTITSKSVAITRMIAGLRMAVQWMNTHSNAQVAQVLQTLPAFQGYSKTVLIQSVMYERPHYSTGFISNARWVDSFPVWKTWQLPVSLTSPIVKYSSIVNMKYWNESSKYMKAS